MDKRVRLVFVPGNPVTLDSLCPKSHLLMLQSRLIAEGIVVDLLDFGTIGMVHEARGAESEEGGALLPGWMGQVVQGLGGFPVLHRVGLREPTGIFERGASDRLMEGNSGYRLLDSGS